MDPLVRFPVEKWCEIQEEFKRDWPRGVIGFSSLQTRRNWCERNVEYGYTLLCPFGDARNGFVGINDKENFYELIIQCPTDDTKQLEEALKNTKLIDLKKEAVIPYAPNNVEECVKRILQDDSKINLHPAECFYLERSKLQVISLPEDLKIDFLTKEHLELANLVWPHKYEGSLWYLGHFIDIKSAYGLFKDNEIISWAFINESGALTHVHTLETYRRKGYIELLLSNVCKIMFDEGRTPFAFCVDGNAKACMLFKKLGFERACFVKWLHLTSLEHL